MSVSISRDEWLAALADVGHTQEDDQGAVSVREFAEMLGLHQMVAVRRLEALVKAEKAVKTKKFQITPDGRRRHLTAYRLVK